MSSIPFASQFWPTKDRLLQTQKEAANVSVVSFARQFWPTNDRLLKTQKEVANVFYFFGKPVLAC